MVSCVYRIEHFVNRYNIALIFAFNRCKFEMESSPKATLIIKSDEGSFSKNLFSTDTAKKRKNDADYFDIDSLCKYCGIFFSFLFIRCG